jgi:hypothetical protein
MTDAMPEPESPQDLGEFVANQLKSVPVVNQTVKETELSGGRLRLTVPIKYGWWGERVRNILMMRKERKVELDAIGAAIYREFDGERTLGELIDEHAQRWKLSFYESRAMILEFIRRLVRRNLIYMMIPDKARPKTRVAG